MTAVEVADITTPEEHLARPRGEHSEGVGRDAVPASLRQSIILKELANAQESVPAG